MSKHRTDEQRTELFSRILLTVLILAGMSPALYFIYRGLVLWGVGLTIVGLVILFLVWKPRKGSA